MDDWVRKELDDRITKLERETVRLRKGVVTDIDPLSVALGGADPADAIVGLSAIDGLALAVDDVVTVLARGNDMLVVGRIGPGIVRGTIAADGSILAGAGFTVAKPATGNYDVTFDVAFPTAPVVVPGAGSSGSFGTRLSTSFPPSTTGFRVIGFDPFAASEATAIKDGIVQFTAMPA